MTGFGAPAIDWAAEGYPEFAAASAKDTARRKAFLNRRDDAERYAAEQVAAAATLPNVVLIGEGTPWARDRRREAITAHVEHRRDGNALHIGPGGRPYDPPRAEVHIGVLFPASPRVVYELRRDYPLSEILRSAPVDNEPACELPASVSIVGGGSHYCTGIATGYAIDFTPPWVIAYRCCVMCARALFEDRWRRRCFADESGRYVVPRKQ